MKSVNQSQFFLKNNGYRIRSKKELKGVNQELNNIRLG
jgi:hypothetical protein